jgi:FkbM family methyltransferase
MKTGRLFFFLFLLVLVCPKTIFALSESKAEKRLMKLHSKMTLIHGSFAEEYPEQVMAVMFIKKNDRVLELGGNLGRNSCIIGSLLKKSSNLVVLESDSNMARLLKENRDHNNLFFQIENSALSKVPLIQSGWNTIPSAKVIPGYFKVNTISYADLKKKHNINFNVLVADCEGALYYILRDDESILDDINIAIVENDHADYSHYEEVKERFLTHGFQPVYTKAGGWLWPPCDEVFYQVWQKAGASR